MNELVFVKKCNREELPFTNSLCVSNGSGIRHDKLKITIRKYEEKLKELGNLITSYGVESTGGRRHEVYNLNEEQASFLITLLKNTDSVVQFKLDLVKEFKRMKDVLQEKQLPEWKETRQIGKIENRNMTDAIKKFVAYAESQGSKNFARYYSNFQRLANKSVGIGNGKRDLANHKRLFFLVAIMGIIEEKIYEGIQAGMFYKDIYKSCKGQIDKFEEFIPTTLRLNA